MEIEKDTNDKATFNNNSTISSNCFFELEFSGKIRVDKIPNSSGSTISEADKGPCERWAFFLWPIVFGFLELNSA
jgi:hypothetical protein